MGTNLFNWKSLILKVSIWKSQLEWLKFEHLDALRRAVGGIARVMQLIRMVRVMRMVRAMRVRWPMTRSGTWHPMASSCPTAARHQQQTHAPGRSLARSLNKHARNFWAAYARRFPNADCDSPGDELQLLASSVLNHQAFRSLQRLLKVRRPDYGNKFSDLQTICPAFRIRSLDSKLLANFC